MSEFQPMPEMQTFWDDAGQAQLEQFGKGTEAMARLAAGFGGEELQRIGRVGNGVHTSLLPADVHGGNLDEDYADVQSADFTAPEFTVDLNNLDKIENRMQLLDNFTQN